MWGTDKSKVSETKTPIKKRRRAMPKGRSSCTYQNKLRRVTSFYNHLTKCEGKFKQKYPTLESFLKVNSIKESNKK